MDPHVQNAHSRIRVFLADLNLVLGSASYLAPIFNQTVCAQNLAFRGPHQQLRSKRPTNRSRAWKLSQLRNECDRSEKAPRPSITSTRHFSTPAACTVRFSPNRRQDNIYNRRDRYRPLGDPQSTCQIQRAHQRLSGEYSDHGRKVVVNYPGDLADTQLLLEPPGDETIEEQETDCGSDKLTDEINLDEIEWDDRSDLDINAAPYQFDLEESLTSEAVPEGAVDHTCPETDWTQQHDPNFDLKNYSADDVDCWARTLSADEFKHLHIMGPDARTESFRQYAISNLNQPTQTLTQQSSSTHEHFEHLVSTSNGCQDYSNYHHHQPDDIGSNNFDQQQLASPDDESRSTFYNHSDDCNSHLEAFDDGTFDDGGFDYDGFGDGDFDDGGFDDGGFDDGGFDDGGFDNGGFDDGGFDDVGFDDGGFDDGGFDDGGFDDSGFEDGGFDGGSNYY
ncbi:hypothetical protein PGTUg99_022398 [Puccinia graminis f. sp. tritici]|uniref:Uncharacterized protein n=1 Tax=Puccinia graminis f. sp. tritici TaxID=56615 RepID=A0A5B0NXL5_PUCGR|nr:hypothetical protein PGTUg99_022398 [Puccinia graminis f. sp. tritici]